MAVIYQTTITRIGQNAPDALCDQMLITFREDVSADIEEFCFIHCHGDLNGSLQAGIQFELGQHHYPVTAASNVAEQSLCEPGYTTLRFDGQSEAELPDTVYVVGPVPDGTTPDCILKFVAQNWRR